ncbi:hypothetical protein JIR001_27370 [Polycladomyces abyssicola]|uniref:Uncharacterized protein n=1 Tax=Polycladomyces abyssicola TaxID=1125966 RepID=A0A8D5UGZ1_9BACL|nr:hypothetical protein [Polycladomyces abyssicola]BCU82954.1 hypothetical protein JIR001_27370 [Polycladomyces abyssicola]
MAVPIRVSKWLLPVTLAVHAGGVAGWLVWYWRDGEGGSPAWLWQAGILAACCMAVWYGRWYRYFSAEYGAFLSLAWLIWVIGSASVVLHHVVQLTMISALTELLRQIPSVGLQAYLAEWNRLLYVFGGIFGHFCYVCSGLMSTVVLSRHPSFSARVAGCSFGLWLVGLASVLWCWYVNVPSAWLFGFPLFLSGGWSALMAGATPTEDGAASC